MHILKYKDYEGTAELDITRGICRGKILFINDLVTYEAVLPSDLQKEFEAAVDDYFLTCTELGREPQKSLKGQFNVRIPPALHKAAILRALADGVFLNDVTVRALEAYVNVRADINHAETKYYFVGLSEFQKVVASASSLGNQGFVYGGQVLASGAEVTPKVQVASAVKGGKHAATRH